LKEESIMRHRIPTLLSLALAMAAAGAMAPQAASAQFERVYHPMYLPAAHNWEFRAQHPAVDRLFAAFDFGHGILYETLWTRPDAPASLLEEEIYDRLTKDILVNPPRMHMPEQSFMPRYARLVPLAKEMFEWAHILHRQTYDILADERIADKDAAMAELLDYYFTSPLAFTDVPKGMAIMDEQHFSMEFRQAYPKFNGLIWAYHWLQVAVYEPLLLHHTPEERQTAMNALLARFWQMLEDPPAKLPSEMPMTPAIAPEFTARYPRFAAIFDNLHMMHDVISDILVSDRVADKRAEIYRQADLFRDPGAMAVSRDEWIRMALAHGLAAQGGPAIGILPPAPTAGADAHAGHAGHEPARDPAAHDPAARDPAAHEHHAPQHDMPMMQDPGMHRAMALVVRLLDDAQVERRIHAVHELHEAWEDAEVQRHVAMMRRMHGPDAEHPADHERPHHEPMEMHGEMASQPGMRRAMAFVVRLLDDPQVQQRIHAVHEYHEAWEDPAVQRHFAMVRERAAPAAGAEPHQHHHPPAHQPTLPRPERPDHQHPPVPDPAAPEPHTPEHDMPMMQDPGMHRAMELVVRLLQDEQVQRRIHAVHELHEAWEDEGVQRHIAMIRNMHGHGPDQHVHPTPDPPEHHGPPAHDHDHHAMRDDPAMRSTMAFVIRLIDDPVVQQRIHAVHELHEAWEDPDVQRHLESLRERLSYQAIP
jgi:hypothetical protein